MKTRYLVLVSLIVIFTIVIICLVSGISDEEVKKEEEKLQQVVDYETQYIDDNDTTIDNEAALDFEVDQQYTDIDFLILLKSKQYDKGSNLFKFKLSFKNINADDRIVYANRISCVVNGQATPVSMVENVSIRSKETRELEFKCAATSKDDEVYINYVSVLYNGHEIPVKFGK